MKTLKKCSIEEFSGNFQSRITVERSSLKLNVEEAFIRLIYEIIQNDVCIFKMFGGSDKKLGRMLF